MKGKALRRAIETKDAIRIGNKDIPLIVDTTELITPEIAQQMLNKNKSNRPVNWRRVEAYAEIISSGKWELTSQGIIFDEKGNLLTGQNRLWAVIYSGVSVYMRVSRGNPGSAANLLDRGMPQSARDLATRKTEKKHSPTEASIARGICALSGNMRPSTDELAETIIANSKRVVRVLAETQRTKKTKPIVMILSAICQISNDEDDAAALAIHAVKLSEKLQSLLLPETAERCWGKGAAFGLAMEHARKCVSTRQNLRLT